MRRDRYLICYDIRDPKRLRRVARVMEAFGTRMQYSVFICDLSSEEFIDLRFALHVILEPDDSVMSVPLGAGYDTKGFVFIGPKPDLPTDGTTII